MRGELAEAQTDVIDLYQIRWPRPDEYIGGGLGGHGELKDEGKVRHIGLELRRLPDGADRGDCRVETLQPPYHMLNRGVEEEILPYCGETTSG